MPEFDSTEELSPFKKSAWTKILKNTGGFRAWNTDPVACTTLYRKLKYFSPNHRNTKEHIEVVMYSLARGYALMKAAKTWQDPFVGAVPTSPTSTSALRGIQWRLVMAYNAFEIVCLALKSHEGGLSHPMITDFVRSCRLGTPPTPLKPPARDRSGLKAWLEKTTLRGAEGDALIAFLGYRREDATVIRDWIVKGSPIATWEKAVMLAKALRNTSAHGSLSASKVASFGLREAMEALPDHLSTVMDAALEKLV